MGECTDGKSELLELVQYEAGKVVTGAMSGTSTIRIMAEPGREDINVRHDIHKLICYFKIINNLSLSYLKDLIPARVCETTHLPFDPLKILLISQGRVSTIKSPSSLQQLNCVTTPIWKFVNDSTGSFKRASANHYKALK